MYANHVCKNMNILISLNLLYFTSFTDGRANTSWMFSQVPAALELEKFVEDVKNGVYPILNWEEGTSARESARPRAVSPDQCDKSEKSETPEPYEVEQRSIVDIECKIEKTADDGPINLTLTLKLEDKMNRQLVTELSDGDTAMAMTEELVKYGLINERDREKLSSIIEEEQKSFQVRLTQPVDTAQEQTTQ